MAKHEWIASKLGHGETMCRVCHVTNREAAILNIADADCEWAGQSDWHHDRDGFEAAHGIDRLRALLREAGEALAPFAKAGELFNEPPNYELSIYKPAAGPEYEIGDKALRHARAVLDKIKAEGGL